jgi:hypothetical protein
MALFTRKVAAAAELTLQETAAVSVLVAVTAAVVTTALLAVQHLLAVTLVVLVVLTVRAAAAVKVLLVQLQQELRAVLAVWV